MLYQIGFCLIIASREDALTILEQASECLSRSQPEDRLPNITANRDRTYTISADIRMENAGARDELFSRVEQTVPNAAVQTAGYLSKHDCGHDDGLPCSEPISICWGEE